MWIIGFTNVSKSRGLNFIGIHEELLKLFHHDTPCANFIHFLLYLLVVVPLRHEEGKGMNVKKTTTR